MNLTDEQLETLQKIIEWWERRSAFTDTDTRVKFHRKDIKIASVRMSRKMYVDAVALAENDPEIGNFNRMVELLIWEKLGKLEEYLIKKED